MDRRKTLDEINLEALKLLKVKYEAGLTPKPLISMKTGKPFKVRPYGR